MMTNMTQQEKHKNKEMYSNSTQIHQLFVWTQTDQEPDTSRS